MRDYIKEQLNEIQRKEEGQLNEIDLSSALGKLRDKLTSKNSKQNREFAKIVSDQFEGDFAKFLKKYLIKQGRKMNTIQTLVNYFKDPSQEAYEDVYHILGAPMLQYFVKKIFGKTNLRGRIKQMTPFLKKVSTGNKELDRHVFLAMSHGIGEKELEDEFMSRLKSIIDTKLGDALENQDFLDFVTDLMGDSEEDEEELEEGIKDRIKNVKRGVRNVLASDLDRERWKVMDIITDTIPNLKKPIRRMIRDEVWKIKYNEIRKMQKGRGSNIIAKIVSKSVMKHIISKARSLYFKEDYLSKLTDVVEDVFMRKDMIDEITDGVKDYYRDNRFDLEKSKKLKKQKAEKRKKNLKRKIKWGFGRKDPIYKDVLKY